MRKIVIGNETIEKDSGFFFGKGLFETILITEVPLFLDFHIERLNESLEKIGLEKVEVNLEKLIEENLKKNSILKIVVTEKNIVLAYRDIPYKAEDYKNGFKLKLSSVKRNSTSIIPKIKSLNYLENLLERENALNEGYNDVLFINEKDNICETSTGNIFFVKEGQLYTPDVEEGLLKGTVRQVILENFNVEIKNFKFKDLEDIDEVFVTNSVLGVMKVKEIDKYKFLSESMTEKVSKEYKDILRRVEIENE